MCPVQLSGEAGTSGESLAAMTFRPSPEIHFPQSPTLCGVALSPEPGGLRPVAKLRASPSYNSYGGSCNSVALPSMAARWMGLWLGGVGAGLRRCLEVCRLEGGVWKGEGKELNVL